MQSKISPDNYFYSTRVILHLLSGYITYLSPKTPILGRKFRECLGGEFNQNLVVNARVRQSANYFYPHTLVVKLIADLYQRANGSTPVQRQVLARSAAFNHFGHPTARNTPTTGRHRSIITRTR